MNDISENSFRTHARFDIDWPVVRSLTKAFITMDLREQHFAAATATKPHYVISPLFWVVGQCFTMSAVTSLFLFARVNVFFFAFVNLTLAALVLATTIFVEFHEVVLNPRDFAVVGHRPVSTRTYAMARFLNLFFYVGLMYLALNLIPMLMGFGLRDGGWLFCLGYLIASLSLSLVVVCVVVILLSFAGGGRTFDGLKNIFAWTQIILILVVVYGGQYMLRDTSHAIHLWGAFPPSWIVYVPSNLPARFVEHVVIESNQETLVQGFAMIGVGVLAMFLVVLRLSVLYGRLEFTPGRRAIRRFPVEKLGSLTTSWADWFLSSTSERVGFWMGRTFLLRDTSLLMRCILPFNLPAAMIVLGLLLGQWQNPLRERDLANVMLTIASLYLFVMAVPVMVYHCAFCNDHRGSWLLRTAPGSSLFEIACGLCKAMMIFITTPLVILFTLTMVLAWGEPLTAIAHGLLLWMMAWPASLAGIWLLMSLPPFSASTVRGTSMGMPPLPLAVLSLVAMSMMTMHYLLVEYVAFWPATYLLCWLSIPWLKHKARVTTQQLWRPE